MFEIQDKKLGKLKVFNVSEARANFAAVLKENAAKIVITRHGRPSKILLDYQEYIQLMRTPEEQALQTSLSKLTPKTLSEGTAPLPGQWSEKEFEKILKNIPSR